METAAVLNSLTRSVKSAGRRLVGRITGPRPDLVALMVETGALVASADGVDGRPVSPEEAATVLKAARQIADLHGVRLRRTIRRFDETQRLLLHDRGARALVLERAAALRNKPRAAKLVFAVAEAVAAVDGEVTAAERQELVRIATALGIGEQPD